MNLSEMNKKKTMVSTDMTQLMPISHDTIDKWKKLSQEQAEALWNVTAERDELLKAQTKDRELIQKCMERIGEFREGIRSLSSENQKLQDELQKLTEENQKLQIELSKTQNISQSLQRSNDDLRNRNGLLSRKEQEQLEERIKDVQARNSKLEKMVVQSSVDAVEEAQKKEKEAENRVQSAKCMAENEKRKAKSEIQKVKKQADQRIEQMKATELLWDIGVGIVVLISIVMKEIVLVAMQEDLILLVLLICMIRIYVRESIKLCYKY